MLHPPSARIGWLIATVTLASCAEGSPPSPSLLSNDGSYRSELLAEYQQLAALPEIGSFGTSSRRRFEAKVAAVRDGVCVEPESLSAWKHTDRIRLSFRRAGASTETLSAADLRAEIVQTLNRPAVTGRHVDLPTARAHVLGRFDCIVAFGRDPRRAEMRDLCLAELQRASDYVVQATSAPPSPPQRLCPV